MNEKEKETLIAKNSKILASLLSSRNLICSSPAINDSSTQNVSSSKFSAASRSRTLRSKRKLPKNQQHFVLDAKTEELLKDNNYEIKEKLGVGAFSEVFKAYHLTKHIFSAVKIIDLSSMSENFRSKFLPRELGNLALVRQEHIIRIFDIFRMNHYIFIFMEYASKGDLTAYLKRIHAPLEEPHACKWFYQMATALNYLHNELNIAHRDIKIDNILIVETNAIKLTDFGFSLQISETDENHLSTTFCGTRPYLSPQIVLKKPYNPFKADIWALGIVLFSMLNNRYPYHYKDRKTMLKEQLDQSYLVNRFIERLSQSSRDLMLLMFEVEEDKRISVKNLFETEWVIKYYDENLIIVIDD